MVKLYDDVQAVGFVTHICCPSSFFLRRCLEDKAREMNISDLAGFYGSTMFTRAGFQLDRSQGVIAYHV